MFSPSENCAIDSCGEGSETPETQAECKESTAKRRPGRPRKPEVERLSIKLSTNVSQAEKIVAEQRAASAAVTLAEWMRCAMLEREPPPAIIIPTINEEVWRASATNLIAIQDLKDSLQSQGEEVIVSALTRVERELNLLRRSLVGGER